ncbi:putative parvulin-type peptidyl-prolyl cis-trans isomerase [Candidatus Nitrotoga sp. BS]|nr:putative parvulin-type peptidyl-prolyl cis-trans isomerase [Candidatus Nitrotoga sp. BS]
MLKFSKLATITLFSALAVNQAYAQHKPVAVVNGTIISQASLDMHVKTAASKGTEDSPELRSAIKEELVNREIMAQEAVKQGFDKLPETISQFELAKQTVLVNAFLQNYLINHPISEDLIKQEFENIKKTTGGKEYNTRHILVKTESEAKSIAAQLKKKGKFEELAKKHSLDQGSRDNGGALGWALPGNFTPTFADALVSLKKDGVSEPVKSEAGWHLIKQEGVRDFKFPDYRDVKGNILKRLQQQAILKAVADMRAKAKIE